MGATYNTSKIPRAAQRSPTLLVVLKGESTVPSPPVLTIGTSCLHWGHNLCLSPQHTGSPERLGTGSHSSSDPFTVPLAWCLVHSRCSVSYKAASAGGKRKILVQGPMVPLWVCFPHVQTGITSSVLTQPERINQESTCGKHQSIR